EVEMGVDLCGADVGMAEHFLHAPQVAAGFEHVGREAVPQEVRVHVLRDSLAYRPVADALLDGAAGDAAAAASDEYRLRVDGREGASHPQPSGQRLAGHPAHRNESFTGALAGDADHALREIEVGEVQ